MNTVKLRTLFNKFLSTNTLGTLGAIICTIGLISTLLNFGSTMYLASINPDVTIGFTDWLYLIINGFFYLSVAKTFITAKNTGNFSAARYGVIILVIANFVLPLISTFASSILAGAGAAALFYVSLGLLSVLGCVYFVFLILEYRKKGKYNNKVMLGLGIAIFVLSFLGLAANIYTFSIMLDIALINSTGTNETIAYVLGFLPYILDGINGVLTGLILLLYPIITRRRERLGY